jgi:hypothetical protein
LNLINIAWKVLKGKQPAEEQVPVSNLERNVVGERKPQLTPEQMQALQMMEGRVDG